MDSVLMTSPSNGTRFKTRLRSTASALLSRSKGRSCKNLKNGKTIATRPAHRTPANQRHQNNRNHVPANLDGVNNNTLCKGRFTGEVYNAIFGRLGHTANIPGDSVQVLFNDLQLYPSKSQVSEMLQCARQCGRRQNGTSLHLTFGEFCVLVREMQKPEFRPHRKTQIQPKSNKCAKNCEVFLGGSCNPTTWRADIAIPELQKHGITYYNPQVSMWAPELVAQEHDAKQSALVLLYVVDSQTRSVAGMIEVAYLVAAGRCVVLVAYPYKVGQTIMAETISQREYDDLVNGQLSLLTLVKSQGVKVHNNLSSALQCTSSILRSTSSGNGYNSDDQFTQKLRRLREVFDMYDTNKSGELHIKDALDAYTSLTNRSLELKSLYNYLSATNNPECASRRKISFEQFCTLVAEFSSDGCDQYMNPPFNDWAKQPILRQCSTNNNSNCNHQQTVSENVINGEGFLVDVYLGGSCNSKNMWREKIAIPALKKNGLSYYNPTIRETDLLEIENSKSFSENGSELSLLHWKKTMDKSRVLLFVISDDAVSLTTMIMAAHFIGVDKDVVLCIQSLPGEDFEVNSEQLSRQAIKDYNRGRVYLSDLAKRKQVPVFENITEAVECVVGKCTQAR